MNLYDLTIEASSQVETYKYPDLDEWRAAIDPVLSAANVPTVGADCVESIYLDSRELYITTSYSVRCCDQTNNIRIPINILKDADPIKAAHRYRLTNAIANTKMDISLLAKKLANLEAEFESIFGTDKRISNQIILQSNCKP